jgi:death-on-curing protein
MIDYLSAAEIYSINEQVVGHPPQVRDRHLLRSAVARPMTRYFGEEAYPTLLDKAAALLHSLAAHHLFYDGNKRTARQATTLFLRNNGMKVTWSEDEAYNYILEIAMHQHDVDDIATWLAAHTSPLS